MKCTISSRILFSLSLLLVIIVGVQSQDDGDDGFKTVAEGSDGETTTEGGDGAGGEEGKAGNGTEVEDAKYKEKVKLFESINNEQGPGDLLEMSASVLRGSWNINMKGANSSNAYGVLSAVEKAGGEERLYLLRLLELIDINMDTNIDREELILRYSGPMASPDLALDLMFRIKDFDGNGYISRYETLTHLLTVDGINFNVMDKWNEAGDINRSMDADGDQLVSLHEFSIFMIMQINMGMGATAAATAENQEGSAGAAAVKQKN